MYSNKNTGKISGKQQGVMLFLLLVMAFLGACTKEVPYKEQFKEDVLSKADSIDTESDYLYTASVLDMSRFTTDGRPFWFGDSKRVRLVWTEKSLQIFEKERDERYAKNVNDRLILEIPVEHKAYECAKDAYGECTSSETEKNDINWSQKALFKFKPEQAKQGALEILPIISDMALGSNCYTEVSSKLTGYSLEANAINFQVERIYSQNIECMETIESSLTETTAKAVFQVSLVKAKSILTKGFKVVDYPTTDEDTFGFFATASSKRDIDGNLVEVGTKTTVMNHWHPQRGEIQFYLSDSFNKPENAKLKELSYLAVSRINQGLAQAGSDLHIKLNEPAGKNPGDIRNSMIVLSEDPFESAPIGYGPSTEDPLTGEVISARTIMYLAGLQQYVKMNYDDIGRALKAQKEAAEQAAGGGAQSTSGVSGSGSNLSHSRFSVSSDLAAKFDMAAKNAAAKATQGVAQADVSKLSAIQKSQLIKEAGDLKKYRLRVNEDFANRDIKGYIKYVRDVKNCTYSMDAVGGFGSMAEANPKLLKVVADTFSNGKGGLIEWNSLSTKQKQTAMDLIIPEVYLPVLLHELGHNLGLRHNFKASEDKANFYSTDELKAQGIEHAIPYSSVMDYGNDLHTLPVMGKYDIAALRYAYSRQVDVVNAEGKVERKSLDVTVKGENGALETKALTLEDIVAGLGDKEKLVEYGYCTDENVGPNAGCRRFDEGTSFSQIADSLISSYKDNYIARSTRNGRENFSRLDESKYAARTLQRFLDMRVFTENFERFKHLFGISETDPVIDQVEFLKDLRDASLKVNRFFLQVLTVPDVTCAIADVKNPNQIVELVPLSAINPEAYSCDQIVDRIPADKFILIGQGGKHLNASSIPNAPIRSVDQTDVRPYWLDKYAAARALFDRSLNPTFNRSLDNVWDIATLRGEVAGTLGGILSNNLVTSQDFMMIDGEVIPVQFKFDYHQQHMIDQMLIPRNSSSLQIRHGNQFLSEILGNIVSRQAELSADNAADGRALRSFVSLSEVDNVTDTVSKNLWSVAVGKTTLVATADNAVALTLIKKVRVQQVLGALDEKIKGKLVTAVKDLLKPPVPQEGQTPAKPQKLTSAILLEAVPELSATQATLVVKLVGENSKQAVQMLTDLASDRLTSAEEGIEILLSLPKQ